MPDRCSFQDVREDGSSAIGEGVQFETDAGSDRFCPAQVGRDSNQAGATAVTGQLGVDVFPNGWRSYETYRQYLEQVYGTATPVKVIRYWTGKPAWSYIEPTNQRLYARVLPAACTDDWTNWGKAGSRAPTRHEYRGLVWLPIINGADGIMLFQQWSGNVDTKTTHGAPWFGVLRDGTVVIPDGSPTDMDVAVAGARGVC